MSQEKILWHVEQKAITFPDKVERDKVLEALWDKSNVLFEMPRNYANALTLVIPATAVDVLQKQGFKFTVRDVR